MPLPEIQLAIDVLAMPLLRRARTVRAMAAGDEDGELMLRYVRGDTRAFETLYKKFRSPLYRYLMRHVRNEEAANDLFQDVWSKLIASRERYEPRAKFSTFIYRIAHNCFIDYYRRSSTRFEKVRREEDDTESQLPGPRSDLPDERLQYAQTLGRYREALSALPAEQRDAFLLYEESGLSVEEIAAITGVGMETAKSRLRYALAKLRGAMQPAPDEAVPRGAVLGESGT
jgi:RNA polymerase sigma-70 factor, ECF subfamily